MFVDTMTVENVVPGLAMSPWQYIAIIIGGLTWDDMGKTGLYLAVPKRETCV